MGFRLYDVDDERSYRDFEDPEVFLGRDFAQEMHLMIKSTSPDLGYVSRKHIRIYFGGGEFGLGYYLQNKGKNDTCVNGEGLERRIWKLRSGDVIRFGNKEMNFAPAFLFSEESR